MFLKQHILAAVLIPLCLLAAAFAYYRFVVLEDFIVQYEGACDPEVENCYLACEDDECSSVYFYALVEKRASDVYAQCGPDITDCEAASICSPEDSHCTIERCDIAEDDCIGPGEFVAEEEDSEVPEGEQQDVELEPETAETL